MLCVMTACHAHFAIFSFFLLFFFNFHFSDKLFLICSYFSDDLSLTVLIKCVLNKKKKGICFRLVCVNEKQTYTQYILIMFRNILRTFEAEILKIFVQNIQPQPKT